MRKYFYFLSAVFYILFIFLIFLAFFKDIPYYISSPSLIATMYFYFRALYYKDEIPKEEIKNFRFRKAMCWLTGRDLLAPRLPVQKNNRVFHILNMRIPMWKMTLTSDKDNTLTFCLPIGPNVFHRIMQRIVLGIIWSMLPIDYNNNIVTTKTETKNSEETKTEN